MSEIKTVDFRGREFRVQKGSTHPEYSFFTFTGEEKDFREKYWDIKPGDFVVDAGASYGAYTLAALESGAAVLAFEPEPSVYPDLVANIALNGWSWRCTAFQEGLWNVQATVPMQSYAPHWPEQTITTPFKMVRLDDAALKWGGLGIPRLDWIKIDVEGAEIEVLHGAAQTLKKFRPSMIIECHTFSKASLLADVISWIDVLGNYSFEVVPRDPCFMVIGRPNERGLAE